MFGHCCSDDAPWKKIHVTQHSTQHAFSLRLYRSLPEICIYANCTSKNAMNGIEREKKRVFNLIFRASISTLTHPLTLSPSPPLHAPSDMHQAPPADWFTVCCCIRQTVCSLCKLIACVLLSAFKWSDRPSERASERLNVMKRKWNFVQRKHSLSRARVSRATFGIGAAT